MAQHGDDAVQPEVRPRHAALPRTGSVASRVLSAVRAILHDPELRSITGIAVPMWINYLLWYAFASTALVLVGHTPEGSTALAAVSLASFFTNATGFALSWGALSAADTLASQAYGAGNLARVGYITQRGAVILTLLSIPVSILWYVAGGSLRYLGQDGVTADMAASVLKLYIPAAWSRFMLTAVDKHFLAIGYTLPPMAAMGAIVLINAAISYALISGSPLGYRGAPLALAISSLLQLGIMLVYATWHDPIYACITRACRARYTALPRDEAAAVTAAASVFQHQRGGDAVEGDAAARRMKAAVKNSSADLTTAAPTLSRSRSESELDAPNTPVYQNPAHVFSRTWPAWSWHQACSGWGEYLPLASAGAANSAMEWGMGEISVVIAGLISVRDQAAQSILMSLAGSLVFLAPLALSIGASMRIGHHMGEGDHVAAKAVMKRAALVGVALIVVDSIAILATRDAWPGLFTDDAEVVRISRATQPLLLLTSALDCVQGLLGGILRGVGKQAHTALANFVGFGVVSSLVSWYLATRPGAQLGHVWLGMLTGMTAGTCIMIYFLLRIDWPTEAARCHARAMQTTSGVAVAGPTPPVVVAAAAAVMSAGTTRGGTVTIGTPHA